MAKPSFLKRLGHARRVLFGKQMGFHHGLFAQRNANPVDLQIKQTAEKIIWGRKISPRLLWGIYDAESWVAACVDEITAWVMADGIDIRPRVANPSQDQKNQLIDFIDHPNPEDTTVDIMEDQMNGLLVLGDDTAEIVRDPVTGMLLELWSMDTTTLRIVTDTEKAIIGYTEAREKDPQEWDVEDIFRLKRNARGKTLFGSSPLRPLFLPVTSGLFAQAWNRNRFENQGNGKRAFIFDEDMAEEQVQWNDAHLKEHKGVEFAGADLVLWGTVKIEDLEKSAQDMDYKGQITDSRDRILANYRVPPQILGIIEAGSLGGGKSNEQRKKFLRSPVNPFKRKLSRAWNMRIVTQELQITDWDIFLPMEDVEDDLDRATTHKIQIESGVKLQDEVRSEIGLPPLDEVQERENARTENKNAPDPEVKEAGKGNLEVVPSPHVPNLTPSVLKMRAGIKSVLRRWRGRVLLRFDRLTRASKSQSLGLLSLGKMLFDEEVAKEWFVKQEINPDFFSQDVVDEDMRVTLTASMGTAARAGIANAVRLGGAETDDAFARTRIFVDRQAAQLAGSMGTTVRSQIADSIVIGVREGLPVREIRKNIEIAFDTPKTVEVVGFRRADGTAVAPHTRTIGVDAYAEMVARTESARMANEGGLESFHAAGIVKVKWSTAKFRVDAKICEPLDGKVFMLSDVQGKNLIPAHPHCRCAFVPVDEGTDITGQSTDVERNKL